MKQYLEYSFFSDLLTVIPLQIASVLSTFQNPLLFPTYMAKLLYFSQANFAMQLVLSVLEHENLKKIKHNQLKIAFYSISFVRHVVLTPKSADQEKAAAEVQL